MLEEREFEHTPEQMAEKLLEFNRDPSDYDEDIIPERENLTNLFRDLQKSEKYNSLVHHLDFMFMNSAFDGNDILCKGK